MFVREPHYHNTIFLEKEKRKREQTIIDALGAAIIRNNIVVSHNIIRWWVPT